MKWRERILKVFAIFVLGSTALNLSIITMNEAVIHSELEKVTWSCIPSESYNPPDVFLAGVSALSETKSELSGFLFQIVFILFFISPPIIAFLLFLIWKELKAKNKMK